ncbi:hypothetical protein F1C16_22565 (plasmid) [Hymenobacter sp. NBH84]|uniref:hypothetical protein n=1 Tax=Hymenobacter sp. NBH84 TaxID=2596915 RepID=UPI001629F523|nr:hypothetical protein [Hymenobacter sp. NBH84]QNE42403.1 hypothetical protein F1C16_22565 [Hymenobacter sp. NBH84]
MGLDIHLQANHQEESDADELDLFDQHSLSRTFCNLMCRRNVVEGEPELDQIGRLTGIDITPLYDMENYPCDKSLEMQLALAENDEEREEILQQAETDKAQLDGNLAVVTSLIDQLLTKLPQLEDLPSRLNDHGYDTLRDISYFADFAQDPGDGYLDNNFGQDLRNFRRFLTRAQQQGSTTVYFMYG